MDSDDDEQEYGERHSLRLLRNRDKSKERINDRVRLKCTLTRGSIDDPIALILNTSIFLLFLPQCVVQLFRTGECMLPDVFVLCT